MTNVRLLFVWHATETAACGDDLTATFNFRSVFEIKRKTMVHLDRACGFMHFY